MTITTTPDVSPTSGVEDLLMPWTVGEKLTPEAPLNLDVRLDYDVSITGDVSRGLTVTRHDLGYPALSEDLIARADHLLTPDIEGSLTDFAVRALEPLPAAFQAVMARLVSATFAAPEVSRIITGLDTHLTLELGLGADGIARIAALEFWSRVVREEESWQSLAIVYNSLKEQVVTLANPDHRSDLDGPFMLIRDLGERPITALLEWIVQAFGAPNGD